ncbi:NAD(P)H nitroreductase [Snodgrassella alvi]|jgi:nitroreductase / dihydropteridine reductase|uniref:NAD(P)H nitroreductase n=1 Tax=Snodgrassella alvi TaxID=1196083 RepID=A0A2N9XGV9_9NEIS|nr:MULTISPECIES: oxygen-insensitive NAD(P)H nitroreductase [Snodgrassella]PIT10491.1 NAD(P)H nitroreductase [Snodgrassella communis]PIT47564.1 NAD(P)H nitroreductase [Snodgrassella alvi]
MNIADISRQRYTTKHYDKTRKIPAEQLAQLFEVIRNSPSSVNSQPWHFFVVDNDAARARIMPAIMELNHPRVADSSHTLIFCAKTPLDEQHLQTVLAQEEKDGRFGEGEIKEMMDKGRHFFVNKNSTTSQAQLEWESKQLYIVLGQLLFAAAAIGIDSTAIEGFDDEKMDDILELKQQGLKSILVVSLGYRAANDSNASRPKSRLPKEQIFTRI